MASMKKRHGAALAAVFLVLAAAPAQAGWFDSEPEKKVAATVSDDTVSQIKAAFDDQRYLDAAKILDRAILVAASDPRLIYWAGELSLTRGRYEDALANFKIISADANMAGLALEGQGIALAQLGRSNEALAALKSAVEKNPAGWRAWNALGSEYDRRFDWASAEAAYDKAIANSGGSAIALNNRGFSRMLQNKLDSAVVDFVAALQKKPDFAPARNNLRLAMSMQGEYDRAVKSATADDQAAVLNNAGFVAMLRGDYFKAQEFLTQAMKAKGAYYEVAAENLKRTQSLAASTQAQKP